MSSSETRPREMRGTGVAPLLFWLIVVCGLAGVTIVRFDEPRVVVPLWFGTIVGLSSGQILALLRLRVWMILLGGVALLSFVGPMIYVAITEIFGGGAASELALMSLVPAAICGYASLTERDGLIAFWFPAMLWMLVILDGPDPGVVDISGAPFAVGLAVLFVAFLRARETRRVTLWRGYGRPRLATPLQRTVLRESPSAVLSQLGWTGLVAAGTLTLAAWVAPHLWQKERAHHAQALTIPEPSRSSPSHRPPDPASGLPCCSETQSRERVREYLTLSRGRDVRDEAAAGSCTVCQPAAGVESTASWSYGGSPGAGLSGTVGTPELFSAATYDWEVYPGYSSGSSGICYGYGCGSSTASTRANGTNVGTNVDLPHVSATPPAPKPAAPPGVKPPKAKPAAAKPTPSVTKPEEKDSPPTSSPPASPAAEVAPPPSPPKPPPPTPAIAAANPGSVGPSWGLLLAVGPSVLALHLLLRALRRKVAVRHLEKPFWSEPIAQRVSNHWQRMLVGLRDAGIRPSPNEQPEAFARRIGLEGMNACATVLERVRHGIRVDETDLATMDRAATAVYRASRAKAGVAGRLAGSVRWPLVESE